jgi:predicted transcriptional regulator
LNTAIGDQMSVRYRSKLIPIPGHWGHQKIHELKKLSILEQEELLKQFKDMRNYNEERLIKDVDIYNKIVGTTIGKSFKRDEIEYKAHA